MSRSVHGLSGENGSILSQKPGKGEAELTFSSCTKFRAAQSKVLGYPFYRVGVIGISIEKCDASLDLNAVIAEMLHSGRNISSWKEHEN